MMIDKSNESIENNRNKNFSPMDLHLLPKESTEEHMMGTTIMAIEYDGGVIMAADTRTSIGLQSEENLSVKNVAHMAKRISYANRDFLLAGLIIAGWDERDGGQVFAIPLGGMITRQPIAMGGSGSTYLWGYMDSQYVPGMSKEQALKFVENAVTLAIGRDGSSGGCVRIAIINKDGVERRAISGDRLPEFYID